MYTLSTPSGILCKDGVAINQLDGDPEYDAYVAWLGADDNNGPTVVYDPPAPDPTATAAQWAAAMTQLNMATVTFNDLYYVFNLAVTLP